MYIYQRKQWPHFRWDELKLSSLLVHVRHQQGRILGKMGSLGFALQAEANLQTLTLDVIKSSEIEGEILPADQVRSSLAKRLAIDVGGLITTERHVDGMVDMMLDATQRFSDELNEDRLFGWHSSLFPSGRSGMHKIVVGNWRDNPPQDPMQVVSGPIGRETVHFQAPDAALIPDEMQAFFKWFNTKLPMDALIKAAIAHLWFVTIHPFDDGNGRIARAITDMQLARADAQAERFYSMSAQIRKERNAYYDVLEETQKGDLDITVWLEWFLNCLERAIMATDETLARVLQKARFWDAHAQFALNDRQRMMLNKLLDGFDGKLTSSKWAKICKCSSDTAVRDINDLMAKNILGKETAGGRSTSYHLINS
jgi:Fic family protein